jgi:AcrR family transcriptional regulator
MSGTVVDEQQALIDAGLAVLRRQGSDGLTVNDVLAEAGLSTRAFYRHFGSKDALVLAIYAHDTERARVQMQKRLSDAPSPRTALDIWIDETLALGFDSRRASRTRPLAREGMRLQAEFPEEFADIRGAVLDPLVDVLRALDSPDPERDARSIHAVAWEIVAERMRGSQLSRANARAYILRFCLPALGLER